MTSEGFCVHSDDDIGGGGCGGGGGGGGGGSKKNSSSAMKLQRYSRQLGLSKKEKILKVCPCFMVADLLIQGVLLITDRHVCFYSNIFGHRRNKKIKFEDIEQISKEKVYALFPTGISVKTSVEKVTFSSATSRDKLLKLLREQCGNSTSVRGSEGHVGSQTDVEATVTGSNEITTQSLGTLSSDLLASEEDDHVQPAPHVQLAEEEIPVMVASVAAMELDSTGSSRENHQQPCEASDNSQPVSHLATAGELSTAKFTDASNMSRGIVLSKWALSFIAIIVIFCGLFVYAFYLTCWLGEIEHQILMAVSTASAEIHGATAESYSQLDTQISAISSEVTDLQKKIMHIRSVLRNLLMYNSESTSGPCQNGKDCSTIWNAK